MALSAGLTAELISVIVPLYNTGDYIEECLQSFLRQTYSNFEVILLDDASTDNSPDICKKYVEKDSRFRYYRFEKREGQGCRRNYALRNLAQGQVVAFVDSDDVVADDMLEVAYQLLCSTDAQIALFRLQTIPCFRNEAASTVEIIDGREFIVRFCEDPAYGAFSCNKVFRKEFLMNSSLYPEGMFYEDVVFIPQVCMNAEKIAVTNRSLYYYRQHPVSVVGSQYFSGKLDQIKAYRMLIPAVLEKYPELSNEIHTKALLGVMGVYHVMIADIPNPEPSLRKEILDAAREFRRNISFFRTTQKSTVLLFYLVMLSPSVYNILLKLIYKKLSRRGKF